ncbi:isoinhibitor K-like, partial [Strongylocentrotus purpuratus]|uniref:BPTI/Kunitz inhibitor domain-containing protein n=1 Tax=Strongylocentrotus purpuratus TaxID=7668 RepID=A0A7M7NWY5_STRPU
MPVSVCYPAGTMTQEELCSLPAEVGPCRRGIRNYYYNQKRASILHPTTRPRQLFEIHVRWFYNIRTQQCEQFNYTGCLGNPNRFEDLAICEER